MQWNASVLMHVRDMFFKLVAAEYKKLYVLFVSFLSLNKLLNYMPVSILFWRAQIAVKV